jgi:hypothetical protein
MFKDMLYENQPFGSEITDFRYIPPGITDRFKFYTNDDIEVQADTGIFRKPNSFIHVEPFYQHCLWMCIVAFEDTRLTVWEQETVKTFFDVPHDDLSNFIVNNCQDESKWTINTTINMKKNSFAFIRPWMWYSVTEVKLVQVFLLNKNLTQVE